MAEGDKDIPYPGGMPDFVPDLESSKPIVNSSSSGLTDATKAVWYTRPVPIYGMPSTPAQIEFASAPGNPMVNTWYDKSDVKGNFKLLDPNLQALYEATAKSYSKRSTGNGLFEDLVDQSAYQSTVGNRVLPHQLLYQIAAQRGVLNSDGTFDAAKWLKTDGAGSGYGTTSSTSRQTAVSLTDPDTARTIVNQALETYLGMSASDEQEAEFLKALRKYEQKNPRISTTATTTTTSPGGSASSSSSMTRGGSNPQTFASDWAMAQEGSAEYLTATKYMDAFMNALKSSQDVVG